MKTHKLAILLFQPFPKWEFFAQASSPNATFYVSAISVVDKSVYQQTLCMFEYILSNEDGNHVQG